VMLSVGFGEGSCSGLMAGKRYGDEMGNAWRKRGLQSFF
jgi:hypothetical protein